MRKFSKVTACILTILMISSMIIACGDSSSGGDSETQSANGGGTNNTVVQKQTRADKRAQISDELPDENFGGADFNILVTSNELGENENGNMVNDATYQRNKAVSERFNVNIKYTKVSSGESFSQAINDSVAAGDNVYDLIIGTQSDLINSTLAGSLKDINTLDHIALEKDWWGEGSNNSLAVNGKNYMAAGDISMSMWDNMFVIYFNKDIISSNSLKSPIDLVNGDAWNFERFIELSLEGGRSYSGYAGSIENTALQYVVSLNMGVTKNGDDGYPELNFNADKTKKVVARLAELYAGSKIIQDESMSNLDSNFSSDFIDGTVLFMGGYLGDAAKLRNSVGFAVGFVPYPKYDEFQSSYYTATLDDATMAAFPTSLKDEKMSGIITEALCAEGYKTVATAYYTNATMYTSASTSDGEYDTESEDMIDTLRSGVRYNFGLSHNSHINNIADLLEEAAKGNIDFSDTYKENESEYKSSLQALIDTYKSIS